MIYRVCEREREKDKEGLCTEISCVWGSLCARARPCPQTITPYRIRLPLRARCQLLELNMVPLHMNRLDFNVSPCFRGVYCRFLYVTRKRTMLIVKVASMIKRSKFLLRFKEDFYCRFLSISGIFEIFLLSFTDIIPFFLSFQVISLASGKNKRDK